jgi:hypothetical protein
VQRLTKQSGQLLKQPLYMKLTSIVLLLCVLIISCKKDKEKNGLPPATQEGKNTFGFLLNGQPWTPAGFNGTANLSISYDKNFRGGVFNLSAYRILDNSERQRITIASDSIQFAQQVFIGQKNCTVVFRDVTGKCDFESFNPSNNITGGFQVTKLDTTNRIIAGTFQFTLSRPGCETINITDGRFDMKY